MKAIINHTWAPVVGRSGSWHHFIITRARPTRGNDTVRVAYMRHDNFEQSKIDGRRAEFCDVGTVATLVDADADRSAERYLSPDAIAAWRAQRELGWDGTVASIERA